MARPCTVCSHPDLDAINRALVDTPKQFRQIAAKHGLGFRSIERHEAAHLTEGLKKAITKHREVKAETKDFDIFVTLKGCAERAKKLLEAIDRTLADPDDPTRFDIGPRAHEVLVTWTKWGEKRQRKTKLSALLDQVDDGAQHLVKAADVRQAITPLLDDDGRLQLDLVLGMSGPDVPRRVEILALAEANVADPRKLLNEAHTSLKPIAELLGKALGQLAPDGPSTQIVNLMQHPDMVRIAQVHEQLTREFPEAGQRLAGLMRESAGAVDVKQIGGGRK